MDLPSHIFKRCTRQTIVRMYSKLVFSFRGVVSISCFGVRVSVMFHFIFVYFDNPGIKLSCFVLNELICLTPVTMRRHSVN